MNRKIRLLAIGYTDIAIGYTAIAIGYTDIAIGYTSIGYTDILKMSITHNSKVGPTRLLSNFLGEMESVLFTRNAIKCSD